MYGRYEKVNEVKVEAGAGTKSMQSVCLLSSTHDWLLGHTCLTHWAYMLCSITHCPPTYPQVISIIERGESVFEFWDW